MEFNGSRFALARRRRGMTKRAIAERIGVSERTVLAYESNASCPEEETAARISRALQFPVGFFLGPDIEELSPDVASFRALTKMTAAQRDMALGAGTIALLVNEWIEKRFTLPAPDLPDLSRAPSRRTDEEARAAPGLDAEFLGETRGHDPEAAAESLRQLWGLGELPVKNMIALLESHGVRVFSLAIDAREVDAFSMWYGGQPFIFLNTLKTAERCRFDAAHELGHLVIHRHGAPYGQDAEREANTFASAFLMPRRSVLASAPRIVTLPSLVSHKKHWLVSAAALNYRLHALGLSTDWTYRTLCVQLSRFGRDREPDEAPRETSQVLAKVFATLREDGITKLDVANDLFIEPKEIDELTFGLMLNVFSGRRQSTRASRDGPQLRVIK